ncbi:MAG: hypothetical protein IPK26_20510 [Planctomycetes bacterium]|nr:hypothetical protein [Planctomycetota bacterium]
MRAPFAAFLGALCGGGIAAAVAVSLRAPRSADEVWPQAPPPVEARAQLPLQRDAAPAVVTTELPGWATVEQRLAAIEAQLDVLVAASARTPVTPASGAAVVDADALQQALENIERRKFETMSDGQLRELAYHGAGKGGDAATALRAIELLLARAKTPDERAELLGQKAMAHRSLGSETDLRESLRCLERVVAENGADSKAGLDASYQMVWTRNAQKDFAGARLNADAIVHAANATGSQRAWARFAGALASGNLGDPARERSELQALLQELGNAPEHEKLAEIVRARLNPSGK